MPPAFEASTVATAPVGVISSIVNQKTPGRPILSPVRPNPQAIFEVAFVPFVAQVPPLPDDEVLLNLL